MSFQRSLKLEKVSVIIPVYNSEQYITECIQSVLNQTYENIEVIIINDGSTDQSYSICQRFAEKDSRINLISIENSGVSTARNIGIDNSTGDYITFVDSDDWIDSQMIDLAIGKLKEENADITIWSYYKNFGDEELLLPMLYEEDKIFTDNKDILFFKAINSSYKQSPQKQSVSAGTTWCKLYKRELLIDNNIRFNAMLTRAQDTIFSMNAFYKADKIVYFNKSLYHYRITNTQISSGNRFISDTHIPFNELLNEFQSFSNKVNDRDEFKKVYMVRVISVLIWHLEHYYFHEQYPNKFRMMRKQIKKLINKEPYKTAIEKVDHKVLPKKGRLMVTLFRKRLILLFYIIYSINTLRMQIKSLRLQHNLF